MGDRNTKTPLVEGATQLHNSPGPTTSTPQDEFQRILKSNPVLVSTGCSGEFCQAGRLIHSNEPRVGEFRSLEVVKKEASGFLWQLWQDGVYTEDQYRLRCTDVLEELENSATIEKVQVNGVPQTAETATWKQTPEELLYGLRLAWKNSRKCIMRSHYKELALCNLRHVTTNTHMVTAVIDEVTKAFNHGKIKPTVFVFPARSTSGTGPMFWSKQLLNFAGYKLDDSSVLGDPSNVQLTQDIIRLGWVPPSPKSKWDLLLIVAMGENDAPALAELPDTLRELVDIEHPRYVDAFRDLGLRWYQFPALSRLGFDIGGVQYTATPFIGWYMDAEIGVRDLADTFRYNTLPDVANAIGFDIEAYKASQEYAGVESIEDLPDHEQLLWLSRAQAELNYAVRWLFLKKGISCTGTLAASFDWSQFDDEHALTHGYRLNADHYWISPPQGSIIPLWHRGGAPNYQPKPLIARHLFDPVKSSRCRCNDIKATPTYVATCKGAWVFENLTPSGCPMAIPDHAVQDRNNASAAFDQGLIYIYYCSNGTTAWKLADKLQKRVKNLPHKFHVVFNSLNFLNIQTIQQADTVLVVVSTTGNGCFPANGANFEATMGEVRQAQEGKSCPFKFSVFGVGDSAYPTFNAAATKVYESMKALGAMLIAKGLVKVNVAIEALPLSSFNRWWDTVESSLSGKEQIDEIIANEYLEQEQKTYQGTFMKIGIPASSMLVACLTRISSATVPWCLTDKDDRISSTLRPSPRLC